MNPYHNTYQRLRAEREAEAGYTALPPTLQTRMGQGLQGYLGGLRSMQPTDNPHGKALFDFFLSGAEDMAGEMARGNPYAVIDPRPRGPYNNPQILDTLGILPVATAAKIPSEVIAPGLLAGAAAAMGKIAKPTDGTPSLLEAMTPGMVDPRAGLLSQVGYHGTPHRFPPTETNPLGEFDLAKIGTGEGAQAYGHGIYVAENPDVAKGYQKRLAKGTTPTLADVLFPEIGKDIPKEAHSFLRGYEDIDKAVEGLRTTANSDSPAIAKAWAGREDELAELKTKYLEAADWIEKNKKRIQLKIDKGTLYEVDIPDEIIDNQMLDWDKPLSQQNAKVKTQLKNAVEEMTVDNAINMGFDPFDYGNNEQKAIELAKKAMIGDEATTTNFLNNWAILRGTEAAGEELLNKHGIKGIKYKDAASRGGEGGTRNFVLFDPSIATITGRN